jgi:hypothetical protein
MALEAVDALETDQAAQPRMDLAVAGELWPTTAATH